jgi:hypothetical protein
MSFLTIRNNLILQVITLKENVKKFYTQYATINTLKKE